MVLQGAFAVNVLIVLVAIPVVVDRTNTKTTWFTQQPTRSSSRVSYSKRLERRRKIELENPQSLSNEIEYGY